MKYENVIATKVDSVINRSLLSSDDIRLSEFNENGFCTVTIDFIDNGLSFEELEKISNLFKTKKMTSNLYVYKTGFCETCYDETGATKWKIEEVHIDVLNEIYNNYKEY